MILRGAIVLSDDESFTCLEKPNDWDAIARSTEMRPEE